LVETLLVGDSQFFSSSLFELNLLLKLCHVE
jgi:hypothetical protein